MTRPRKLIYDLWAGMVKRCTDKNHVSYKYYGAKGIKVCDEWVNDIEKFISDMGERPDGMTLDRINPKGNYEPSNCRWASIETQNRNRSDNRYLTLNGVTKVMADWAKHLNTSPAAIHYRITKLKMTAEQALTIPITRYGKRALKNNG